MIHKLDKTTLRNDVYRQLLNMILSGTFRPNTRLDENDIANQLGISRTPLREALNRLIQEGLVTEIPYKGNFVKALDPIEIKEIYESRMIIEGAAVKLAALNMKAEQVDGLVRLTNSINMDLAGKDVVSFSEKDSEFHLMIASHCGNTILFSMVESLINRSRLIRVFGNQELVIAEEAVNERHQITAAIKARQVEAAEKAMVHHLQMAYAGIHQLLKKYQREM